MPLSDDLLEKFPFDDVLSSVYGLLSVSVLESGKIGVFATALCSIILHEKLLVLEPPRNICQNAVQETTCNDRLVSVEGVCSQNRADHNFGLRIRCRKR